MAISGSVEFKVTTEELVSKADVVKTLGDKMIYEFRMIEDIMTKTRSYWIGEGGDVHRHKYDEQKETITKILNRLMEHPDDLLKIAGVYNEAESTNIQESQALPEDIF